MSERTRDMTRYAAMVARDQDLVVRLVGTTRMAATAEVSPDRTLVATILQVNDALEGRGHAELHVIAVDGGRRWQVTGAGVDAADPRRRSAARRLSSSLTSAASPAGAVRARDRADGPAGEPRRLPSPHRFPEPPLAEPGRRRSPRRRGRACRTGGRHGSVPWATLPRTRDE